MCGIGGVVRMSNVPIQESQITALLLGLQRRGKDASGVALVDESGEEVFVSKHDSQADKFVESSAYRTFLEDKLTDKTQFALVHTRLSTCGSPHVIANNHPIYDGKAAIVHNGMIHNHKKLFTELGLERKCETDSDILRAIIDEHGLTRKAVRELTKVGGTVATLAVDPRSPGKLLICRSGNPLEIATSDNFVYFSSTPEPIRVANRIYTNRWGIWAHRQADPLAFGLYPTDTAWLFEAGKGLEWHQEFKTAEYQWSEWNNWGSWDKKWKDHSSKSSTKIVQLPAIRGISYTCVDCGKQSFVKRKKMRTPAKDLRCAFCNTSLEHATKTFLRRK
jgi:asparagine synthetase B (glutamine-hydrolysing)